MKITKQSIENMILTADPAKRAHIIGRACVALFKRQTEVEKQENSANTHNNRGFCKADAREGCLTDKSYIKNKNLQDWQVEQWLTPNVKGVLRIVKYWAQLAEEAETRAAK